MITACDHDHDHDHHDDDYYYYYHYHPFIIIHILSIYYPWWWMWISWRQYWDSHPLASVEHVPRTLCQAPVRLPIGQWSPVTSCANLSGELSQDCPIIHMYIHIHVYIYIVYHSMVNLSQTDHHHGRLNHIYTHCFYISMCVPIIYTQDSFCFIADMSEKENAGQFLAVASRRIFGSAPANFKELTAVTS